MDIDRYREALRFTAELHRDHVRKGSEIPYLSHLMSVSSLVFEYGGDLDQAIGGLLHDAIEDQAESHGGIDQLSATIERHFGVEVLRIVRACTDAVTFPKPPWRQRKLAYIEHLKHLDGRAALVSAADKLHNARSILKDLRVLGEAVFERFSTTKAETLWYYETLAGTFLDHHSGPLADEVWRTVEAVLREAGGLDRDPLRIVLQRSHGHVEWAYYDGPSWDLDLVFDSYDHGNDGNGFSTDRASTVRLNRAAQDHLGWAMMDDPATLPLAGPTPYARLRRLKQRFPTYRLFAEFVESKGIQHKPKLELLA